LFLRESPIFLQDICQRRPKTAFITLTPGQSCAHLSHSRDKKLESFQRTIFYIESGLVITACEYIYGWLDSFCLKVFFLSPEPFRTQERNNEPDRRGFFSIKVCWPVKNVFSRKKLPLKKRRIMSNLVILFNFLVKAVEILVVVYIGTIDIIQKPTY
jgi:hypothetical protein